jgi:hypothetical protein
VLGVGTRIVARRPWAVEARSLVPVSVDARAGDAGPSDAATTELRRHTWRVGWRASGEVVHAVADALAQGNPFPPGSTMSPPPARR